MFLGVHDLNEGFDDADLGDFLFDDSSMADEEAHDAAESELEGGRLAKFEQFQQKWRECRVQ